MHDRTAGGSPELLRLSLGGVGRGEALTVPALGTKSVAHESRIEIHRVGLVEWYVNSPAGLEQGFTLEERPAGTGQDVQTSVIGYVTACRRPELAALGQDGRRARAQEGTRR